MTWPKVQRRIAQLIREDNFYTEAERDNFDDIDPAAIREALAQRGIVGGKVVDPEKLNSDPFIQRVMQDTERVAEQALMERAKGLISDFCRSEYGSEADFSDPAKIGVAYTTVTDDEIPIQVNIDLVNYRLERYLDDEHRVPMDKKSRVNKYTPEGRVEIHKNLAGINMAVLYHLMNNPCGKQSVEYNDNRIALYVAQKGKCAVSGAELGANQVDCHHKKPLVLGGNDSYQNLIIVSDVVHILIHSSNERTIRKYLKVLNPDKKQLAKLNKLRVMAEMPELVF